MMSDMTIHNLASQLHDSLVQGVGSVDGRHFIITSFSYPNGDLINAYLTKDCNGHLFLSDLGTTMYNLRLAGVPITRHRKESICGIMSLLGVQRKDDAFMRQTSNATAPDDFLRLCEAVIRISNFEYDSLQPPT